LLARVRNDRTKRKLWKKSPLGWKIGRVAGLLLRVVMAFTERLGSGFAEQPVDIRVDERVVDGCGPSLFRV
jgi:hypothetical protein